MFIRESYYSRVTSVFLFIAPMWETHFTEQLIFLEVKIFVQGLCLPSETKFKRFDHGWMEREREFYFEEEVLLCHIGVVSKVLLKIR